VQLSVPSFFFVSSSWPLTERRTFPQVSGARSSRRAGSTRHLEGTRSKLFRPMVLKDESRTAGRNSGRSASTSSTRQTQVSTDERPPRPACVPRQGKVLLWDEAAPNEVVEIGCAPGEIVVKSRISGRRPTGGPPDSIPGAAFPGPEFPAGGPTALPGQVNLA